MLKNGVPFKVTCEEGQALLRIAINFALPEKLGDSAYSIIERSLAADEARKLYKELRDHSPLLRDSKRWICFGPNSNYDEIKTESGAVGHKMKDLLMETAITLDEDAKSGAIWCLIVAMHPSSPMCQSVGTQADIFWPLAEKLRCVRAVKEAIGLDKAKPRRWASDEDDRREESKSETKKLEK
jgi:hypothetical protein